MQEVKEICDRMLDAPAPPMTSPDDLLRFARRTRARHRARLGVGFAAATLAAAATLPLALAPQTVQHGVAAPTSAAEPPTALLPVGWEIDVLAYDTLTFWRTAVGVAEPAGDLCAAEMPALFKSPEVPGSCEVITIGQARVRTGLFRLVADGGSGKPFDVTYALRYRDDRAYLAFYMPKVSWDSGETPGTGMSRKELAEKLVPAGR